MGRIRTRSAYPGQQNDSPLVNGISTQPDAAKRKPLYDQLNDFLLDEQFVIMVSSNAESVVTRANVQNLQWDLHGARKYAEVWLA